MTFAPRLLCSLMLSLLVLPLPTLAATAKAKPSGKPITLTLLALNDFHGNVLPPVGSTLVADPARPGGTRVSAGGAAYLSSLVQSLKKENPSNTLVVAAGDMIGASQLTSGLFHDEPTIEVLSQMGLNLSSVGNHEFDRGQTELLRMQKGGCYPASAEGNASKTGVVGTDTCMNKGKFYGAKYQYLAANVLSEKTGATLFPPYAIRTLSGIKVGFIGMTLKDTPSVVTPAGVQGLMFMDEVQTVNALVPELKAKGVTVFVVLIHQGGENKARLVQDKSCPGFTGDILSLSDRFDPAIDVIVSGHTHQEYVCFRPDGKLITQSGSYGRLLTKIDLTVSSISKKVIAKDANNHLVLNDKGLKNAQGEVVPLPVGYVPLKPDPAIEKIVKRYGDLSASITDVVVGRLAGPLDRRTSPAGESTLGNVVADAFLAATSDASYGTRPAQIAFTNRGGLRSDLTASLEVSFGHLYNVMPFNNNVVTMDLTGKQLLRLLEQQWESPQNPGGGRILSTSAGFTYAWDAATPDGAAPGKGQRVVPGSAKLNGVPIEPETSYRITINNFMASGGDNFTILKEGTHVQEGEIDLVIAKIYFRVKGVLQVPALDRIARVN